MKICVIGNSHIWALRAARTVSEAATNEELDTAFWGAPGPKFYDVRYKSGRVITPDLKFALYLSDGKYENIDPEDFDALIFHGPALNVTGLMWSLRRYQAEILSYSHAFLRNGIGGYLDKAEACRSVCRLIQQIRSTYKGRILISPAPLISERSNFFAGRHGTPGERAVVDDVLQDYFEQFGAGYVPQPARTVVSEHYTAARYSNTAVRPNGTIEYRHMNNLYGAEVLRAIAGKLDA